MKTAYKFIPLQFCFLSISVFAMPGNIPSGSNLVSKGGHTGVLPYSSASNPASLTKRMGEESWDMGGFSLPLLALEIGDVDNLGDRLDELEEALEEVESLNSDGGEEVTPAEAAAVKSTFDGFIADLGEDAYVNFDLGLPLPTLPVLFKAFNGVIAINVEASLNARFSALGDELIYDENNQDLSTDTSVYVRSGEFIQADLSYGRELKPIMLFKQEFKLDVGGRLKFTHGALSRQVIAIDDDNSDSDDDSAFDRASDNYDLNKKSTLAIGLDVGTSIHNDKWYVGAMLRNLIPQEFDYADIGTDCAEKPSAGLRRDCEVAAKFAGRIALSDSYKIDPQLMLEGSYLVHESGLHLFGSIESNSVENVSGGEYQWAVAGVAFSGPWWLPSVELSYNKNLAGQKLDLISLGAQFFKAVNLQVSASPEKAEFDGDSINRSAAISISFFTTL